MYTVLTVLHVFICLFLIVVVLLQAGKGGGMGIAFGGGGSQTVFGSSGAGNFLTKLTAGFAVAFFLNSLVLAYMSSQSDSKRLQVLSERRNSAKDAQKAADDKIKLDIEKAKTGKGEAPKIEVTPVTPGAPAPKIEVTPLPPAAPAGKAAPAEGKATEGKAADKKAAPEEAPAKPKRKAPKAEAPKEEAAPSEAPQPQAPAKP